VRFLLKQRRLGLEVIANTVVLTGVLLTLKPIFLDIDRPPLAVMIYSLATLALGYLFITLIWKNPVTLLYLTFDHQNNQLRLTDVDGIETSYRVAKQSKSCPFGIWLYLADPSSPVRLVKVRLLFIGKWQIDPRGFRALHRHLAWYL
jgi:hypothetical protein